MIYKPVCPSGRHEAQTFCVNPSCQSPAFICKECDECSAQHDHNGQLTLKRWQNFGIQFHTAIHNTDIVEAEIDRDMKSVWRERFDQMPLLQKKHAEIVNGLRARLKMNKDVENPLQKIRHAQWSQLTGGEMFQLVEALASNKYYLNEKEILKETREAKAKIDEAYNNIKSTVEGLAPKKSFLAQAWKACKRLTCCVFILFVLLCILSVWAFTSKANKLVHEAQTNLSDGNLDLAMELIRQATDMYPSNVHAKYILGKVYYQMNRLEECVNVMTHAINMDPDNLEYADLREQALYDLQRYSQALADSKKLIEHFTQSPSYLLRHANILTRLKQFQEALPFLQKVIELDRTNVAAYRLSAITFEKLGFVQEALGFITMAIQLGGDKSDLLYVKSYIQNENLMQKEALQSIEESISLSDSPRHKLHYQMADILWKMDRFAQSKKAIEVAIELNPNKKEYEKQLKAVTAKIQAGDNKSS